jgi:aryl-alcohol dehydrogenase-like predicted oxidoreductase
MDRKEDHRSMDRRKFMKLLAAAAVGGSSLVVSVGSGAKTSAADEELIHRNERPSMTYRRLGRTNFMSSRLVFGCGAALRNKGAVRLLNRAFEAGINHYDVGSDIYYKGSERNLAPFLKAHRNDLWLVSKAPAYVKVKPEESISSAQAKSAADFWTRLLERSLRDLQTDYVDAYYLMGVSNPSLVRSEEVQDAFVKAKAAGKVGHFGLSVHKNTNNVLEAAIETGRYDLAMIGITPAGWYDWTTKELTQGTPPLIKIQPLLERARNVGIGLIGMKAGRYLAPMKSYGKGDPTAFDSIYDEKLIKSPLSPFQRAYAYVLEHGLDVVNADMQNFKHLEENIIAAATAHKDFS